ncbi:MAG: hypothetical protein M1826_002728 [Phylliscum demangeonii]|nr:MAG: hypothetical protein M1826_002728 [Phylliscum demangeonii]
MSSPPPPSRRTALLPVDGSLDASSELSTAGKPPMRQVLRDLKENTKSKTKKLFGLSSAHESTDGDGVGDDDDSLGPAAPVSRADAIYHPSRVGARRENDGDSVVGGAGAIDDVEHSHLQKWKDAVAHPKDTIRSTAHKAADKLSQLRHRDGDHDARPEEIAEELRSDPAFNPKLLEGKADSAARSSSSGPDQATGPLHKIAKAIAHPKETIMHSATKTASNVLSTMEHPHVGQAGDHEFLQSMCSLPDTAVFPPPGTQAYLETADKLEGHRERMRVAWITGRHVSRVRVVPKAYIDPPRLATYEVLDDQGKCVRVEWDKWLGHMLLYHTQDFTVQYVDDFHELKFDVGRLRSHLERLVMASAPWQAWAMHLRRVYRWEDPAETGRWLALYVVLWYTQHMMVFVWGYLVYMVVWNRIHPSSLESLRESIERNQELGSAAYRLSELIDKHGREDWLGPFIEQLGPYVQLQLGDLANLLEVLSNFYTWKAPSKTAATVFLMLCCAALALVADVAFCMKLVWFGVGAGFFGLWPIASRFPRYRYLVSPIKWMFWDIPTHAEWSFQYLRSKAQLRREELVKQKAEEQAHEDALRGRSAISPLASSVFLVSEASSLSPRQAGPARSGEGPLLTSSTPTLVASEADPAARTSRFAVLSDDIDINNDHDNKAEADAEAESDADDDDETDFYSTRCEHHGIAGRLIIFPHGLRFVRNRSGSGSRSHHHHHHHHHKQPTPPSREIWRRSFTEIVEMKKPDSTSITASSSSSSSATKNDATDHASSLVQLLPKKLMTSSSSSARSSGPVSHQLVFSFVDGHSVVLSGLRTRDEAFNMVVGFSCCRWQSLQSAR